jgi:integrase
MALHYCFQPPKIKPIFNREDSMAKINLTNKTVDNMDFTSKGQIIYWDTQLKRFGIRVGRETKTFICEKKIDGKTVRVKIATYPLIDVAEARKRALKILSLLEDGRDINAEKRVKRAETVTLESLYNDYVKAKSKQLNEEALRQCHTAIYEGYKDWLDLEVLSITEAMIEQRYRKFIFELGDAQANQFSTTLMSLFNFFKVKYKIEKIPLININVVDRLSGRKLSTPNLPKTHYLEPTHLKRLFEIVKDDCLGDYLKFVLFTGITEEEAASLRWKDVSMSTASYFVRDSKHRNPIELPMSVQLIEIMERRLGNKINEFVFPSRKTVSGHLEGEAKNLAALGRKIGRPFTALDLQATFVKVARSLDVSQLEIKSLVEHKMIYSGDFVPDQVEITIERLRRPVQLISDTICRTAEI